MNSKMKSIISTLVSIVLGIAIGVSAKDVFSGTDNTGKRQPVKQINPDETFLARYNEQLQVSAEQKAQIETIVQEHREEILQG